MWVMLQSGWLKTIILCAFLRSFLHPSCTGRVGVLSMICREVMQEELALQKGVDKCLPSSPSATEAARKTARSIAGSVRGMRIDDLGSSTSNSGLLAEGVGFSSFLMVSLLAYVASSLGCEYDPSTLLPFFQLSADLEKHPCKTHCTTQAMFAEGCLHGRQKLSSLLSSEQETILSCGLSFQMMYMVNC